MRESIGRRRRRALRGSQRNSRPCRNHSPTKSNADTLYKRRVQTAGKFDRLSQNAFKQMMRDLPHFSEQSYGSPTAEIDWNKRLDHIFMSNVGPNKQLKFELTFGHFCDAIADVARARYPSLPPQSALRCFHDNHLAPLFTELFGQETDESVLNTSGSAIGDGGGAGQPSLTRRDTRLVLTTEGTLPRQASFAVAGPALSMSIHEQYLPTDKTARYEIKLNSSNHTPSQSRNGSGTVSSSSSIANHTDFVTTSGSAAVGATAQPWAGAAAPGIAAGGRFLRSAVSAQDLIATLNYGDAPTSSNSSVVHVMGKQGSYVDPTSTRTDPMQPAATSPGGTSSVVSAADFAAVLQQLQAQILNVQSLTDANARLTSENAELRSALAAAGARR